MQEPAAGIITKLTTCKSATYAVFAKLSQPARIQRLDPPVTSVHPPNGARAGERRHSSLHVRSDGLRTQGGAHGLQRCVHAPPAAERGGALHQQHLAAVA